MRFYNDILKRFSHKCPSNSFNSKFYLYKPKILFSLPQKSLTIYQKSNQVRYFCSNFIKKPEDEPKSNIEKHEETQSNKNFDELTNRDHQDKNIANSLKSAISTLDATRSKYVYEFNKAYEIIDSTLKSKIDESHREKLRNLVASIILILIIIYVCFGSLLRRKITEETADLAKETLENENLKIQTQELAMAVTQAILRDDDITSHAATFLHDASIVPETQLALLQLTLHVLQHPDTLSETVILCKKVLDELAKDKRCIDNLVSVFSDVFNDPKLINELQSLVLKILADPETLNAVTELALKIIVKPEVIEALNVLATETSQKVLTDHNVSRYIDYNHQLLKLYIIGY